MPEARLRGCASASRNAWSTWQGGPASAAAGTTAAGCAGGSLRAGGPGRSIRRCCSTGHKPPPLRKPAGPVPSERAHPSSSGPPSAPAAPPLMLSSSSCAAAASQPSSAAILPLARGDSLLPLPSPPPQMRDRCGMWLREMCQRLRPCWPHAQAVLRVLLERQASEMPPLPFQ